MQDVEHRDFRLQSNGMDEVFVVATSGTLADQMAWIQVEHKNGELVVIAFPTTAHTRALNSARSTGTALSFFHRNNP